MMLTISKSTHVATLCVSQEPYIDNTHRVKKRSCCKVM
jgi:hypothetical protein